MRLIPADGTKHVALVLDKKRCFGVTAWLKEQ